MNLKNIIISLLTVVAILHILPGCGNRNSASSDSNRKLARAETIVDSVPEEASAILDSIRLNSLDRTDRHRATLLRGRLQYEGDSLPTSDSLMAATASYFGDRGDRDRRMQALFIQAQIRRNNGDYAGAMRLACEGGDLAVDTDIPLWQGRFAQLKADLFSSTGDYLNDAAYSLAASRAYARQKGDGGRSRSLFAAADAAVAYCALRQYDRSIDILDSIRKLLDHNKEMDVSIAGYLSKCEIPVRIECGQFDKALKLIENLNKNPYYVPSTTTLCYEAYAYMEIDSIPKAYTALEMARQKALTPNDYIHLYDGVRHYAQCTGDIKLYTSAIDSIFSYQVKVENGNRLHPASTAMMEYNRQKAETERKNADNNMIAVLLFVAVGAIIVVVIMIVMKRKAVKSEKELIRRASQINELGQLLLTAKDSQIIIYREQWRTLNSLIRDYYEMKDDRKFKTKLLNSLSEEIAGMASDNSLAEIEDSLNRLMDNVIIRIREQFPFLDKDDIRILTYSLAGWSPKAIALALGIKKGNCATRKSRILDSIAKSDAPDRDWILSLFESRKKNSETH